MFSVKRSISNPILKPQLDSSWESAATFNWCPVKFDNKIQVVYRAMGNDSNNLSKSIIGIAESEDGVNFKSRRPFIIPELEFDKYGCEDPRITKLNDKYYIFYTALSNFPFNADGIKVAVAVSKDLKKVDSKHLVTPFNAKAMILFPELINGQITAMLTANTDLPPSKIALIQFDDEEQIWSSDYWLNWYKKIDNFVINPRRNPTDHVEIGAPPIKTEYGWLILYSYIKNYESDHKSFGIEALLLDLNNPLEVVGKTKGAFLVPETIYEKHGQVENVVFPSGVLLDGDDLKIYYGATDTTGCIATIKLSNLLPAMRSQPSSGAIRFENNPLLKPNPKHNWEAKATFNAAAIDLDGKISLLYRAMSLDNTSVIGLAESIDGFHIDQRSDSPIYLPREEFEQKKVINGNSGCEDPRLVEIEDQIYMLYTAYNGIESPKVAISQISKIDFLSKQWNFSRPIIITPDKIDDKDAAIFPTKIDNQYLIIHRIGVNICGDFVKSLDLQGLKLSQCIEILKPRLGMWDSAKVGLASPPLRTDQGWLLFYHGISTDHNTYRLGVALLELDNPTKVLSRLADPVLEPVMSYEKQGQVPNVVFPCGIVNRNGTLFIYYGGADSVLAGATLELNQLIKALTE